METNFENNPWIWSAENFRLEKQPSFEEFYTLGNGNIIQQGNFEEFFSGNTASGSFCKGLDDSIWKNEKAWKRPYQPSLKMLVNAPDWTPVIVRLNEEVLDLNVWKVLNYTQVINVREAFVERTFDVESPKGHQINVRVKRFVSLAQPQTAVLTYNISSLNFEGRISLMPVLNGDLKNDHLQLNELNWNVLQTRTQKDVAHIWSKIRLHDFHTCVAMSYSFFKNNEPIKSIAAKIEKEKVAGFSVGADVRIGDRLAINKYVSVMNSSEETPHSLAEITCEQALLSKKKGWNALYEAHVAAWSKIVNDAKPNLESNQEVSDAFLLKLLDRYRQY